MTDHARSDRQDEHGSPRKNESGNGGGEETGAGQARSKPGEAPPHYGPSTNAVDEGLEGAILDPDERRSNRPTGAGAEAAEGIRGGGSDETAQEANADSVLDGRGKDDSRKEGSEPLEHRNTTHKSRYGGDMGEPRNPE